MGLRLPLICLISTSRSFRSRAAAQAASIGWPKLSTSVGYIQPSERLALCEIASSSLPALRCASIHFHRSSGCQDSSELKGAADTLAQSRKKMLR
jgi:diaminopimelate decarboxylase